MLRILFVCTGNRCRSPFAAASLASFTTGYPVTIDSVGTAEIGAQPSTEPAIAVARSMGIDLSPHRSKSIAHVDSAEFDAILGFERNHIAAAVVEGGAPYERAFLLPELVRLVGTPLLVEGDDPVAHAKATLERAHQARGTQFVPGEEVDDPIGQPLETYQRVFKQIHELARATAAGLLLGTRAPAPEEWV